MPESLLKSKNFIALSACAVLAAFSVNSILDVFFRQFWFDEAITITEFLTLRDPADIYRLYSIPNNHIVFNLLLRLWINICRLVPFLDGLPLRVFPAVTTLATIIIMFRYWGRRMGRETAIIACLCLTLSLPFAIYATAIRGYMLSFLLVIISLEIAIRYKETGRKIFLAILFIMSFLAVGTTPTNLIAFAAIYIYLIPSFHPKEILKDKLIFIAILPVTAFILFYFPISAKLFKALSLREGWGSGIEASMHFYSAFCISFLPLIALAAASLFTLREKASIPKVISTTLIFLLPLIIFLLKAPAPFPRALFCLWPIWIFMLGKAAFPCIGLMEKKLSPAALYLPIMACILWASAVSSISIPLSNILSKGGQDDFFSPYFMREEFRPISTAEKCIGLSEENKGIRIFIDFAADFPSIFFYGINMGTRQDLWIFDRPGRKVESFEKDEMILVVARNPGEMESISKRFNMKSFEPLADCGYQKIYLAKLK